MRSLGILLTACLLGCSSGGDYSQEALDEETFDAAQQALLASCGSGRLSDNFKDHTCFHAAYGPFKSRAATAASPFPWFGTAATDPPPNSPTSSYGSTHSYYTVTLPSAGGSYTGTMRFRPTASGDHALFFNGATLTIKPQGGSNLTPDAGISPSPGAMVCAGFTGYEVFALSSATTYEITLSSASATTNVLFEQVSEQVARWYQDSDGDTWGKPSGSVLTACAPPAGYSATRGSDCNDANASVNPTAAEVCGDAVDSNCNGNDCT